MKRSDTERLLRIELLQARAAVERAELANALHAVDTSTRRARSVTAAIGGFASGVRGAAPMLLHLIQVLREHPWVLSTIAALVARRPLKRLLLLGVAAFAVYLLADLTRRRIAGRRR